MSTGRIYPPIFEGRNGRTAGFVPTGADGAFQIPADQMCGIAPEVGDRMRDAQGKWWLVREVAEADGKYALTCELAGGAP